MPIYWIWLTKLKGLSLPERLWLLQNFADPEEIYLAEPKLFPGGIGNALEDKDLTQARRIAALCSEESIRILTYADADYPEKLRNIDNPPLVLYFKGKLPNW